jgi:hypothetical protein
MIQITEPFHGAVLNHRHGEQTPDGLRIEVRGQAPLRARVSVNGQPARWAGHAFVGEVVLCDAEADIVAEAEGVGGAAEHCVRVVWDRRSRPRYRFAIDDNSFFLRDIAQHEYASLFDCFYLRGLRDLHERYGTKFVLNCYYTTGDDFSLPDVPDRYRGEWEANADWLCLAFHAYANEPDRPYEHAPADLVIAHLDRVEGEIRRFAGEAVCSPPTIIHWGLCRPDTVAALAGRGVRVLSGYFVPGPTGWDVNYRLDDERSEYLSRRDALKDFASGVVFSKIDIVVNTAPVEQIVPTLAPLAEDPNTAEVMDILTHEQYFWPFYENYVPDHFERLDAALRWLTERGYEPVFFHEGLLGGPEPDA